ncbi:hypothetical protein A4X13_0g4289 [Tilletia indica]|uniref:Uncharacterized protein n=1 Tax=Tilletia indica TaxID=43049 RepID=A0A177TSD1_9BASI|nr:hypothetical protein A4X13_0g4289 [Tilletia indica]
MSPPQDDEWTTCMRADEGLDDSDLENEYDAHKQHSFSRDETELIQQALDIGAVNEVGIVFKDNPFAKAARIAQLRKHTVTQKPTPEPVTHLPDLSVPGLTQSHVLKKRSSATASQPSITKHKSSIHPIGSPQIRTQVPIRTSHAQSRVHVFASNSEHGHSAAASPGNESPEAPSAAANVRTPIASAVTPTHTDLTTNGEVHTSTSKIQSSIRKHTPVSEHVRHSPTRDIGQRNSEEEPSPFAYNVQDAYRCDLAVPMNVSQTSDIGTSRSDDGSLETPLHTSTHLPSMRLSPSSSLTGLRPPLQPAWVRAHRAGPLAGRLKFEPVPANVLPDLRPPAGGRPDKHNRDSAPPRNTLSSPLFDSRSASSFLSQFAFREGETDPEPFSGGEENDMQERWASSSSTLIPSSSPRPEPIPARHVKKVVPANTPSAMTSMWPSLAAKYNRNTPNVGQTQPTQPGPSAIAVRTPNEQRRRLHTPERRYRQEGQPGSHLRQSATAQLSRQERASVCDEADDEEDDVSSWSTLWVGSGNRLPRQMHNTGGAREKSGSRISRLSEGDFSPSRQILSQLNSDDLDTNMSLPRTRKTAVGTSQGGGSASGATIRLSSAFKLPSMRLGNNNGPSKRPRLEPSGLEGRSHTEENRPPPAAQTSRRGRAAFVPTPLERWKATCEEHAEGTGP